MSSAEIKCNYFPSVEPPGPAVISVPLPKKSLLAPQLDVELYPHPTQFIVELAIQSVINVIVTDY